MRTTRVEKKQKRRKYIKSLLWTFLVIIPFAAVTSAFALDYAMNREQEVRTPVVKPKPSKEEIVAFKYSYDTDPKELYRVEIKKFDKYEDAEASLISIKNKRLNGFIIKEQGYLVAYGIYMNKSQADTAAKFLKRKGIESTVNAMKINGFSVRYNSTDKNLIDLLKVSDEAIMEAAQEKAALSLESLYSSKEISGQALEKVLESEARLDKYLNYLETVKSSEDNKKLKEQLEAFIKEALADRLSAGETYSYYDLQDSLLNQFEALQKFYESLVV